MDIKSIKRKVVKQLVEGYEFTTQLQLLLSKLFDDHGPTRILPASGSGLADELIDKILGSFDKIIAVLGSFEPVTVVVPFEGSRNTSSGESLAAVSDGRFDDSGDSGKRPLGVSKGKRGCYKRKRKSQSWTVESNTLEDTHAWRKYGQKDILNAKYPRSYFRCTHKYTQGCMASKQVQKLEHDSGMFQITYIGNHTCNPNEESLNKMEPSEMVMDSENTCGSCILISHCDNKAITSADNEKNKGKEDENSSVKEEETNIDEYDHEKSCPTGDLSLVWQEFMAFDDQELMYCCGETSNSRGVDHMDLMVFGSRDLAFEDNDHLSFSDAYCL